MTFDLHIHSNFSDGCRKTKEELSNHMDYRVITDHDTADFYQDGLNGCSFTGMEITIGIDIKKYHMQYCELLFYGFPVEDYDQLRFEKQYSTKNKTWAELMDFLQPWRNKGAKLLAAHPYVMYRTNRNFAKDLDYVGQFVDGFEALHDCAIDEEKKLFILDYCRSRKKISSAGSDSHGDLRAPDRLDLIAQYPELFEWIPEMAARFKI